MQSFSLNTDWQFHLGPIPRSKNFAEQTWSPISLPHDWSIELPRKADNPSGANGGFFTTGYGWYRKWIEVPEAWREKIVLIEFEGVYMNAEIWLNENYLGRHPYGYTSFVLDLTPHIKPGQPNELRVSVNNACHLNSRWYSGSGIYRPVRLWVGPALHVAHWGIHITTPQVSSSYASVVARTRIQNDSPEAQEVTLRTYLIAPDGVTMATSTSTSTIETHAEHEFSQKTHLPAPSLWSPQTPNLYQLHCDVLVDGKIIDSANQTFGIRSMEIDAQKGLLLNGQAIKLKGGCVHHDNGVLGAASYPRAEERKVELLKASGFNAVRCAHNPPAPAFLEACDRLGMLVIDEAFDCWREGKHPYDYHVAFDDWWQRDLESMLLRDRNHPSILLWSIGNEVVERDGRSGGVEIARKLVELVRRLDPTRPITAALCASPKGEDWSVMDAVFAEVDVCGYNYEWKQYQPDHARLPRRVILGTESKPREAFESWMEVLDHPYVIGDFVWTALDYLGEVGIGRVHNDPQKPFMGAYPWLSANSGDLDLCGFKRPQSYYRDTLWSAAPAVFIAVHHPTPPDVPVFISEWGWPEVSPCWTWPKFEGQTFTVEVYSNCERVELLLNGRSLGSKPAGRAERFSARFEVPYTPGELKAVGFTKGQPAVEHSLQTAGKAALITLTPDREILKADGQDLCYVTVEITDRAGRVHPHANQIIRFELKGEGTLIAVGNANPTSTEAFTSNQRKAFRGRCLAVIKSTGNAGEISLRARASGLAEGELILKTIK